jgi:hypothetical protein
MPVRVLHERHQTARRCAIRPVFERRARHENLLQRLLEVAGVKGDVVRPIQPGRRDRTALALNELQAGVRSRQVQDRPLEALCAVRHVLLKGATKCLIKPEHRLKLAGAARDVMVGQFHDQKSTRSEVQAIKFSRLGLGYEGGCAASAKPLCSILIPG